MNYLATSINTSPVITQPAAEAITDVRGYAVKFDDNGNIVLAGAVDTPLGIGLMTCGNQGAIAAGGDVDIQIRGIGVVYAGAEITKGAPLAVNANGQFIPATGAAVAIALESAPAAGAYIQAILAFTAPTVSA